MYIDNKFKIGEVVYLLTDEEFRLKRVVTGITVRSGGYIVYELSCEERISHHTECEIIKHKVIA